MKKYSRSLVLTTGCIAGMSLFAASVAFAQAADTTPPSVPGGVSASTVSSSQIDLTWAAATDNVGVTGYGVFRNGSQVATTSSTSYDDTGLAPGTTYSYTVDAFDAAGNLSTQSASTSATTFTATPPTIPTGLSATAVSASQVNLQWNASTDSSGTLAGYKVFRNSTQVGTTTATSFSDTGLSASTGYNYTVAAYDTVGNVSSQSSVSSATTLATSSSDTTAPSVPTALSASAVSSSQINLSWNASTDNVGVTGYRVYRNGTAIANVNSTSYSDSSLAASTTYSYTVAAFDAAGNVSGQSGSASAMTLASGGTPVPTYVVPPTVDIGANGSILIHGLTVTSVGTNSFTGTVWGITYTVNYNPQSSNGDDFRFFLRGGDDAQLNASDIQVGDQIGVQGKITQSSPNTIQAQIVRNYSITMQRQNHGGNYPNGNAYGIGNGQSIQSLQALLQQLMLQFRGLRGFRN